MDDQERAEWIAANAARLHQVLARPEVRAELLALLGGDDGGRRRQRRLEAARQELETLELRLRLDDEWRA